MQYMLIMLETPEDLQRQKDLDKAGPYWAAWSDYVKAIHEAGIFVSGNGLQGPQTATTVRIRDGKRHVQDGPFADTKEIMGGYFIVDLPNLDEAMAWAEKAPCAPTGSVEIRPVLPPNEEPQV